MPTDAPAKTPASEMTFEEALAALEAIVNRLNTGNMPLEESMTQFEEGMRLNRLCAEKLEKAKKKIEELVQNGNQIEWSPVAE